MKWPGLGAAVVLTACIVQPSKRAPTRAPAMTAAPVPSPASTRAPVEAHTIWSIRAFPRAALSVALPENGVELDAKDLGHIQALAAKGVQLGGAAGPRYVMLAFPITNQPQGASIEQRLLLLPYLLDDLGPDAKRSPIDFDGLHGVEFVTHKDMTYSRTRVFATPHTVMALTVSARDPKQTSDSDTTRFFESLQWYDE
jgi:hypothetical protein